MEAPQKVNVLGTGISIVNFNSFFKALDQWIENKKGNYVCVTGMHGVMESMKDENLRSIHNKAGMATPDGMSMVWYAKLKGIKNMERVCGPDLFPSVCEYSVKKGYTHFFYGGAEGVPELLKEKMTARYPGLKVVGTYSPPFRPLTTEEDQAIINRINALNPTFVWIGISTPKQEKWMHDHQGKLNNSIMFGVGAAFDMHSGIKQRGPKWIQKSGFEWLYRLCQEPKRLGKRYLVNIPRFIFFSFIHIIGIYKLKPIE